MDEQAALQMKNIQQLLKNYKPTDIFNYNETALY